jgi:hypothetical protein
VWGICSPTYTKISSTYTKISRRNLQYPAALPRGFFIYDKGNAAVNAKKLMTLMARGRREMFLFIVTKTLRGPF